MKLQTRAVEKVWGRRNLPAPFVQSGSEPIGEIRFNPPPELPQILVKYLFTSEKLSIQVHPGDDAAPAGARGKDECWLILDAEPGSALGIGFDHPLSAEALRAAALDGSIEKAMTWYAVHAGDFFYLPAGTVHAIGPGITLVEVQQNSDITYRLYDYGRPRDLHLEAGVAVSRRLPHPATLRRHVGAEANACLVDGPFFRLSQCRGWPDDDLLDWHRGPVMILPLVGSVRIGGDRIDTGDCGLSDCLGTAEFAAAERTLLISAFPN